MMKRIFVIFRIILLKIKYGRKINLNKRFYTNYIESLSNVTITNGNIIINGYMCMKRGSRLGVNNGGKIVVGSGCFFNSNTICAALGTIEIGNNVSFGPNVCLYDHDHRFNESGKLNSSYNIGKIVIGNNVWVGAGAVILRDTIIGDNCVIGAGTVVKGKIPANSLVKNDRDLVIKKLIKR